VRSNPLAQGHGASRVRFRDAGQPGPKASRSSIPHSRCREQLPVRGRRPWTIGRTGRTARASPRDPVEDFAQPHPGPIRLATPCGAPSGQWTRRSRACNPLVKDQHPDFASVAGSGGEHRGRQVSRFTPLHPLSSAGCPSLRRSLPVRRAPSECLILLSPEGTTALRRRSSRGAPRRDALAHRVTGRREQRERGAPSADDEHQEVLARTSLCKPQCRSPGAK
jgi:hypothetical protein